MKIKTKKQLNLPQLIEWRTRENTTGEKYVSNKTKAEIVFDVSGFISMDYIHQDDTFTVEVEKEITEDMEFDVLVGKDRDGAYNSYDNVCIFDFIASRMSAIYIMNDDLTMTLIWRDGGLVE